MKKLWIVVSYLAFFVLGGFTFTYLSSTEASSTMKNISVFQGTINYFVDKVKKTPPEGQEGFIYQGTTYVPIRFVAESLDESVTWDGTTKSIYIGDAPTFTYLKDLKALPHGNGTENNSFLQPEVFVTNAGETFNYSYKLIGSHGGGAVLYGGAEYLTNGKFKGFQAYLAPATNDRFGYSGSFKIYADDKLIYDSGAWDLPITDKLNVSVDLEGASKVKLDISGSNIALLDPKFIQ